MKTNFTKEQREWAINTLKERRWVSWSEITKMFEELEDSFLGNMYKPSMSFIRMPTAIGEKENTGIVGMLRLDHGYQDVVMSRPLVPANFQQTLGVYAAIELVLTAVGDFHAVSTYVQTAGMVE